MDPPPTGTGCRLKAEYGNEDRTGRQPGGEVRSEEDLTGLERFLTATDPELFEVRGIPFLDALVYGFA